MNQKIDQLNLKLYPRKILKQIQEAYECYMNDGKPDVGVQKLGQLSENLIHNVAVEAKKKGDFLYAGFKPPKFIANAFLITNLEAESVIGLGILERCSDFAKARNAVSHSPKSLKEAAKISETNKENFALGLKLIVDLCNDIKIHHYSIKP